MSGSEGWAPYLTMVTLCYLRCVMFTKHVTSLA